MNEDLWNMVTEAHPELKGREGEDPKELVALIKIIGEAKREEADGNKDLSEYKNPDKALALIRETRAASDAFSAALQNGSDDLMTLMEVPGYYAAQNLHENDFIPTDKKEVDNLLHTHAPLRELASVRNDLVTELTGNIYTRINCEIRNTTDIKEINNIIEQKPLSVLALMAVSEKNREKGLPLVKVSDARALKEKLDMPQVNELSSEIPVTNYGLAFEKACALAKPAENTKNTANELIFRQSGRE